MAQECRNPQKHMPIGMLGSLGISTLVYIIVGIVLLGVVSYTMLNVPDPIAVAVNALGPKFLWLRFVIKIAILAGLTSVVLVMLLGQARIFATMAKDGLLPKPFAKISPRFRTPFFSTVIVSIVCFVLAGIFPVGILGQLTCMGALLAFAIVCFGILVLRYKQPTLHRPFKTPFVPWIPLAGTIACVIQMIFLPGVTWGQFLIWMIAGCVIYFGYSMKKQASCAKRPPKRNRYKRKDAKIFIYLSLRRGAGRLCVYLLFYTNLLQQPCFFSSCREAGRASDPKRSSPSNKNSR